MPNKQQEQYVITLLDSLDDKMFQVIATTKTDLAIIIGLLTERYVVCGVTTLANLKDYDSFLSSLRMERKPGDLNFGSEI